LFTQPSRRTILGGLSALGVSLMLEGEAIAADAPENPRRIDVHHHYVSPACLAALEKYHAQYDFPGIEVFRKYSPTAAIEAMDRGGVANAVLSTTTPGVWFGDDAQARVLARDMNEYGAKLVGDHKGRFVLFAVLPLPDVEASLKEIDFAFGTLKAEGISVLSSYGAKWLGDPSFAPIWEELNRRKAVVFSHATAPLCCRGLVSGIPDTTVEFNTDTSRTIINLIESGTAARFPDIRFIFSHAGGTIPSLAGRYLAADASKLGAPAAPNSKLGQLRRFYYDTAGSANPVQMASLKMIVSASQIMFGTDFPWGDPSRIAAGLKGCGFTEDELRAIDRENAVRLLPSLKA
jgi:6-methylsalicylate decarboxylase